MTTATRRVRSTTGQGQTGPAAPSQDEANATAHTSTLPDCETLLVGALLDAGPVTASKVTALVRDDDFADPHNRVILAAIRDAATAGESRMPAVVVRCMTLHRRPHPGLSSLPVWMRWRCWSVSSRSALPAGHEGLRRRPNSPGGWTRRFG